MCNDGVSLAQLQMAIEMAEQQTALTASWTKEIAHLAGHAGLATEEIASAEAALKSAQASLGDAVDKIKTGSDAPDYEVRYV
jgi:multidrug resistance efflux pump